MFVAVIDAVTTYKPITEATHAGKDLFIAAMQIGIAYGVGCFAAKHMHKNHLHWHWSLLVLLVGVLSWMVGIHGLVPFGFGTLGAGLAVLVASRRGRRWQQEEQLRGGEPAQIAKERITPRWTLRRLVLRAERRNASEAQPEFESRPGLMHALVVLLVTIIVRLVPSPNGEKIFLGYDRQNNRVYVPMKHILLVGATEAGKTTAIRRILEVVAGIQKSINHGVGAVIIDGKGDDDLRLAAESYAKAVGRAFHHWSTDRSLRYSFLAHGKSGELVDRILATEDFSDDYYLRIAQRFLGFTVRALIAAGKEVTLKTIVEYLDPKDLKALGTVIDRREPGAWDAFEESIPDRVDARELQAIKGLQHRIAVLAESEVGPLLEPGRDGQVLNLLDAVSNGEIVYFNLNANAHRETAKMLGAMIVMDLVTVFAVLQKERKIRRTMLITDDIEGFANEAVIEGIVGLVARVRSSGGMAIVGTQTCSDIQVGKGKVRLDQLLGSIRTKIICALPGPDSAEIASRSLGDHEEGQITEHLRPGLGGLKATGTVTRKSVRVRWFEAADLMYLDDGEAVVHVRGHEPILTQVCMPV